MKKRSMIYFVSPPLVKRYFCLEVENVRQVRRYFLRWLDVYLKSNDLESDKSVADCFLQFLQETEKYYEFGNKKSKSDNIG